MLQDLFTHRVPTLQSQISHQHILGPPLFIFKFLFFIILHFILSTVVSLERNTIIGLSVLLIIFKAD